MPDQSHHEDTKTAKGSLRDLRVLVVKQKNLS